MLKSKGKIPLLGLAPTLVVVVGFAAAFAIALLGTATLRRQSDLSAQLRSRVLSVSLAARLSATPEEERVTLLERAARRSGAELLLVNQNGGIAAEAISGGKVAGNIVDLLVRSEGESVTEFGRARFSASPLAPPNEHLSLIVLVSAPEKPFATGSLIASVAALTALLVGAAALVALALTRDVDADVRFLRERIVQMAKEGSDPVGRHIPVRSVDQIGVLTSAFNLLVDRFTAAEHAYRQDLAGALAYDRDRTAFLAALSHELRTPLNAILGFTDVLLSEVDGPLTSDARENLNVVRSSGGHLRALIDDILDLSALESGELRLDCRPVDIYPVAAEVAREMEVTARAKAIQLELRGSPATAFADPRRVRQIISNIVGNAVKFTEKGSVLLRVDPRDGGAMISVSDTGPGIAADEREAIFQEYWQSRDAQRRRLGTGLGLAITRRLVQMHRGFIDLKSQLGKGSTFTVVLPSRPPPKPAPKEEARPPLASEVDLGGAA
ncbi:MAG TPA: HAMP domain-containing sensor histidine kinase [Polyangiaceae bacterium]|nr:HAMP domain-containing sensor histidine kinase [Polyangiaceae bacterium]